MKNYIFIGLFLVFLFAKESQSQVANGSIAKDFTVTDIEGNSHHLYDYLDQGKTVYIDFFACHCPFCWTYHNTGYISSLYDQYGIEGGTNEVMVFGIELDANNGTNEFYGISGNTQGNWTQGTNYPLINPEGSLLSQFVTDYDATFYPLIYAICPDRTITFIGKKTTVELYQHINSCMAVNGITTVSGSTDFKCFETLENKLKIISNASGNEDLNLYLIDLSGREILREKLHLNEQEIDLNGIKNGLYLVKILAGNKLLFSNKIIID